MHALQIVATRPPALLLAVLLLAVCPAAQAQEAPAAQPAETGAASLDQRVRQIEEQMLEIQSILGALQSLVKGGGGAAPTSPGVVAGGDPGSDDQRLRIMETQINALSRQVEQLTSQLSNLGVSPDQQASQGGSGAVPGAPQQPAPQFGTVTVPPEPQTTPAPWPPLPQQPEPPQSQAAQLPPGLRGAEGQPLTQGGAPQPAAPQPAAPQPAAPGPVAALSPEQARVVYDQAYGNLVRRDFASAEQGFRQFLANFPGDPLAGNAQYWLGETHYLRNQFREAADSFLKAYQSYPNSNKAPESLVRLGSSLAQLGNRDDACATFAEVGKKFPDAPDYLKQRTATERRRAGC
ncbi:MAG: tol-pal system protein YbgF [Pseudomonadota bacterium]|nr:tol-pal system protein YbgF [Pseudomonadota bacterium]